MTSLENRGFLFEGVVQGYLSYKVLETKNRERGGGRDPKVLAREKQNIRKESNPPGATGRAGGVGEGGNLCLRWPRKTAGEPGREDGKSGASSQGGYEKLVVEGAPKD